MDTLYIGDIPEEYHFAKYNQYYIDLYNTDTLSPGNTYNFYRVYLYNNYFSYQELHRSISNYSSDYATSINVSNNFWYRADLGQICCISLFICMVFLFLTNLFTSIIRKNGILSGLL